MALTKVDRPDGSFVRGFVPGTNELVPLGRTELSWEVGGGHFMGIDDSFSQPVLMRAYWDPHDALLHLPDREPIGYMHFVQVRYNGDPVPPEPYRGLLANRRPYLTDRLRFVDFMDPAQAVLRETGLGQHLDPFYAWNSALTDGSISSWNDLTRYRRGRLVNGMFYRRDGDGTVAGASIAAEIPTGLLSEKAITDLVTGRPRFANVDVDVDELGVAEPFELVLDRLRREGQILNRVPNAALGARAVGRFVLIDLPDDELMGPSLCITPSDDRPTRILVWLVPYHELFSAEQTEMTTTLWGLDSHTGYRQVPIPMDQVVAYDGRGNGGLEGLLHLPLPRPVELKFWTWVMTPSRQFRAGDRPNPVSGFTWSVHLSFDVDERTLRLTHVTPPRVVEHFDCGAEITRFSQALKEQRDDPVPDRTPIDTSNFTLAAIRRAGFGAGHRLQVDR